MTRSYALDTDSARGAGQSGNFISETGKYKGVFTRAEAVTSKKGTEGIEFSFRADDKREAEYLTLWTYNKEGKELYGLKMLNAIMTCVGAREIKPVDGTVDKWNGNAKVPTKATIFPALMGKPIGLLLQRAEYEKDDGSVGSKVEIFAPFKADTEQTAAEVLDRVVSPVMLAKMVATLHDKPIQGKRPATSPRSSEGPSAGGGFPDDDIPF